MQQKQVLDLIETIVKPLRDRITQLEKENEKLKAQIGNTQPPLHNYMRPRSSSKQERPASRKAEAKDAQSPGKRKEEKNEKPAWGYARSNRPENPIKSPNAKDKIPLIPTSPKAPQRTASKQKLQPQKRTAQGEKVPEKKITGGKKVQHNEQPQAPQSNEHHTPREEKNQ